MRLKVDRVDTHPKTSQRRKQLLASGDPRNFFLIVMSEFFLSSTASGEGSSPALICLCMISNDSKQQLEAALPSVHQGEDILYAVKAMRVKLTALHDSGKLLT